jgi:hypothetical protein
MKAQAFVALAAIALYGCSAYVAKPVPPKPVVILGNQTHAAVCECPDAAAQRARADKWKAYAEQLETKLGIPHENEDKP